jgi:hypothetical protein
VATGHQLPLWKTHERNTNEMERSSSTIVILENYYLLLQKEKGGPLTILSKNHCPMAGLVSEIEVVWDSVQCLSNGEAVSLDGTHLGHNLPDFSGNQYCINLVPCAGNPIN